MSDKLELAGTVKEIFATQTFPSGFQKREFVITTQDEKYPQHLKFEAVKDNCAKLDNYQPGDHIEVGYNLRGNEFSGKYFVSLQAWKFDRSERRATSQNGAPPPRNQHEQAKANAYAPSDEDEDEKIPF